jgi:hypothetical protein
MLLLAFIVALAQDLSSSINKANAQDIQIDSKYDINSSDGPHEGEFRDVETTNYPSAAGNEPYPLYLTDAQRAAKGNDSIIMERKVAISIDLVVMISPSIEQIGV